MEDWQQAWQCRACGDVKFGNRAIVPQYGCCQVCGAFANHERVAARPVYRFGFFQRIEIKTGNAPSRFHERLAKLLMIDADGGDSPAAVIADAMALAADP